MVTTTVEIALASDGHHDIVIRKALGSSAEDAAKAEELAINYVSHILPKKVSGNLTLSVRQSANGDFIHCATFKSNKQEMTPHLKLEPIDLDTLSDDDSESSDVHDGEADGDESQRRAGSRNSTTSRQPSVPDSVSLSAGANNATTLPCLRCAKRIIHNSKDKSATREEKMAPELDGTINVNAMRCRREHEGMKCYYCKKGKRLCLEVCQSHPAVGENTYKPDRFQTVLVQHVRRYSAMLLPFRQECHLLT